ncbi:HD domain-containing protein [Oscillospiraceae bacterium LCP25S3_E10]|nr:HD domain-containing protein [Ruminococcus sp.]MDD6447084.1 HD domain-containing protein [Ruminococcus sp.]MDY2855744.1 HD domain-containing protein [Oscillospiraceae bacterium]
MTDIALVINKMIEYYQNDPKRINHFLKVYSFCKAIGYGEELDERTQYTVELSGVVHDIGIKISEEKYGSSAGKYQEQEGPALADKLLRQLNVENEIIERVCFLVGHHHTYNAVDGIDYQILIEADFLVNAYEDNLSKAAILNIKNKIFKTKTGTNILKQLYGV